MNTSTTTPRSITILEQLKEQEQLLAMELQVTESTSIVIGEMNQHQVNYYSPIIDRGCEAAHDFFDALTEGTEPEDMDDEWERECTQALVDMIHYMELQKAIELRDTQISLETC